MNHAQNQSSPLPEFTMSSSDTTKPLQSSETGCGSVDFVQALRLREESEIDRRRIDVENEWQSSEDHLDNKRFDEAAYFLGRMIVEARRLLHAVRTKAEGEE